MAGKCQRRRGRLPRRRRRCCRSAIALAQTARFGAGGRRAAGRRRDTGPLRLVCDCQVQRRRVRVPIRGWNMASQVLLGRIVKVTPYPRTPRGCRMVKSHAAAGAAIAANGLPSCCRQSRPRGHRSRPRHPLPHSAPGVAWLGGDARGGGPSLSLPLPQQQREFW
jgi:hypothetical protein